MLSLVFLLIPFAWSAAGVAVVAQELREDTVAMLRGPPNTLPEERRVMPIVFDSRGGAFATSAENFFDRRNKRSG